MLMRLAHALGVTVTKPRRGQRALRLEDVDDESPGTVWNVLGRLIAYATARSSYVGWTYEDVARVVGLDVPRQGVNMVDVWTLDPIGNTEMRRVVQAAWDSEIT
jgi:hypothetical protein